MSDKKHIQAYIDKDLAEAIDKSGHPELKNLQKFSPRVEALLKVACEVMGIEIKPKDK